MSARRRKAPREKDLTRRLLSGDYDEDRVEQAQRFSQRSKHAEQNRILRTTLMRAAEQEAEGDSESLPAGRVIQVHSLFSEVEHQGTIYLCVIRKTLARVSETGIVVGDQVRFRPTGSFDESGRPEAVIEQALPRRTVLTRSDSFRSIEQHPIVANADQMLIVASLMYPRVKWGLIDRMIIAAQSGGLRPIVCLNKLDLLESAIEAEAAAAELEFARSALKHYESMDIDTLQTSALRQVGLTELREHLQGQDTVLAGHSGVGKSSLIRSIQPQIDIRIGEISRVTEKGRHTTSSARRYPLDHGGAVIDTPGVKVFGLWGVRRDNLEEFFPDILDDTAPEWRRQSYRRIAMSLPEQ